MPPHFILPVCSLRFALCLKERHTSQHQCSLKRKKRLNNFKEQYPQLGTIDKNKQKAELGTLLFEITLSLFAHEWTLTLGAMALLETKSEALWANWQKQILSSALMSDIRRREHSSSKTKYKDKTITMVWKRIQMHDWHIFKVVSSWTVWKNDTRRGGGGPSPLTPPTRPILSPCTYIFHWHGVGGWRGERARISEKTNHCGFMSDRVFKLSFPTENCCFFVWAIQRWANPKNWKMSARAIAILVNKTKHKKRATAILGKKQNERRPKNKPEKKQVPSSDTRSQKTTYHKWK